MHPLRAGLAILMVFGVVAAASTQARDSTFHEFFGSPELILVGRLEPAADVKGRRQFDLTVVEVIRPHPKFKVIAGEKVSNVDPTQLVVPIQKNCLILAYRHPASGEWTYYLLWETDDRLTGYARTVATFGNRREWSKVGVAEQTRFYLGHLVDANEEIRTDAWMALRRYGPADLVKKAQAFPRDKVWALIRNDRARAGEKDLAASLLALSGKSEDADALFKLLPAQGQQPGFWVAILALKPKEYMPRAKATALAARPPEERYPLFQAVRTLYELRPAGVPENDAVALMSSFLDQPDFLAAFAIDEMRRWKRWEMTGRILGLHGKKGYENAANAILCFALRALTPEARAFVRTIRTNDAASVKKAEELLQELERSGL